MNCTTRMNWKLRDLRACVAAVLLGLPACNQLEKIEENDLSLIHI